MDISLSGLDAASAFDIVGDIAYLLDRNGLIAGFNTRSWDRFAAANNGAELTDRARIIGRPLLDFVSGGETRETYRAYHEAILEGRRERISFFYRCDAPETRRDMRMVIAAVGEPGHPRGILYHSIVLRETTRPPIRILERALRDHGSDDWPLVTICSYCKDIRAIGGDRWVPPDVYYREGGSDDVRLSHSVCPSCFETVVNPALKAFEEK